MGSQNRYQFLVAPGAKEDLRACAEEDGRAAAVLSQIIREVFGDLLACEALIDESYEDDVIYNVELLGSLQTKRINAYRVKLVEIHHWRLITAVDHPTRRVALMGVMHRDQDYERDREYWASIEREYDELGFARYGRG